MKPSSVPRSLPKLLTPLRKRRGRRNLTPGQKLYLIGKKYKEEKKDKLESLKQNQKIPSGKNYHTVKTAQRIAEEKKEHGGDRGNQYTKVASAQNEHLPKRTVEKIAERVLSMSVPLVENKQEIQTRVLFQVTPLQYHEHKS